MCFCKSFVDGTVFSQFQGDKSLVQHSSSGVLWRFLTGASRHARGKPSSLTGRLSLVLAARISARGRTAVALFKGGE